MKLAKDMDTSWFSGHPNSPSCQFAGSRIAGEFSAYITLMAVP